MKRIINCFAIIPTQLSNGSLIWLTWYYEELTLTDVYVPVGKDIKYHYGSCGAVIYYQEWIVTKAYK